MTICLRQTCSQDICFFLTHDSITRAEFEHPFGLKRITAYSRLKGLEEMCVIQAVGYGKETVYVSGKK
ncbi:MAG: hypothetical protein ACI3ZB_00315 [Prevotella sp.]